MGIERLFEKIGINWEALKRPRVEAGSSRCPSPMERASAPSLDAMTDADLESLSSLEILYDQAVARRWLEDSEANFFRFLSTAAYCRREGNDPPALFAHMIRSGNFPATLADEDWAITALKQERSARARNHPWLTREPES